MENETVSIVHQTPRPCGRPVKFTQPEQLWDKFVEYCDWVDSNPWQLKVGSNSMDGLGKDKTVSTLRQEVRPVQRAYTLFGFCAFAGIHSRWNDFRRNYAMKRNFRPTLDQIENVVCAQQLDGALINQFNGSLVARLNGIADKTVTELVGKDGEKFEFPKLTVEDMDELKRINGV